VIEATYAAIDAAFAELLSLVDDDCTVMVVSDHGFGPGTRALRIHHLLAEAGFCTARRAAGDDYLADIDWERTLAYMPTPGSFGLNLNLRGRQSRGLVDPAERAAVEAALIDYLGSLRDPQGGGPLFAAVLPAERAYAGPYAGRAPDLLLVPNDPALMLQPDRDGPTWDRPAQLGLHRMEGIWMLRGPGAPARPARRALGAEHVAGLLAQALGLGEAWPAPAGADAADALIAAGLPVDAWSTRRDPPPLWSISTEPVGDEDHILADERPTTVAPVTDQIVFERLRAMGYL
jgi:hypothetical protein